MERGLQAQDSDRVQFLLHMYDQLWNNINRHITTSWESVAGVIASLAVFGLLSKGLISIDLASTIIVVARFWLIANTLDSQLWFNRNIHIISNIERQLLNSEDGSEIHYYFTKHRKSGKFIQHFIVQLALGASLVLLALLFHVTNRTVAWIRQPDGGLNAMWVWMPIGVFAVASVLVASQQHRNMRNAETLAERSPGATWATGINGDEKR